MKIFKHLVMVIILSLTLLSLAGCGSTPAVTSVKDDFKEYLNQIAIYYPLNNDIVNIYQEQA